MNGSTRDAILGIVAGLRGEKRADTDEELRKALGQLAASAAPLAPVLASIPVNRHRSKSLFPRAAFVQNSGDHSARVIESMKIDGVPLREWLSRRGLALYNGVQFGGPIGGPMVMPHVGGGKKILDSLGAVYDKTRSPAGAVFLGFKDKTPDSAVRSITAHEVGHAARLASGKLRPRVYSGSKTLSHLLGYAGAVRASMSGDEISGGEAAGWQTAAALASMPMLNEEVQASRIGSRLAGLKGLKRLGAFRGVPSYIALASTPALAYIARKLVNKASGKK